MSMVGKGGGVRTADSERICTNESETVCRVSGTKADSLSLALSLLTLIL